MLVFITFALCVIGAGQVSAQEATPEPTPTTEDPIFRGVVEVDSAFVRVLPDFDAEPIASVFEDDVVEIVGRNLDGTWFEVRRPYRMNNLGWIYEGTLEWDFAPEFLPLTDITTGVLGDQPLTEAPPFGMFVVEGAALRDAPTRTSQRIINIPPNVVIPVLERNLDASWLHVNYLGYDGWIIGFTTRDRPDTLDVLPLSPIAPAPDTPPVVIIPPEIQLAQAERLRTYMVERRDFAMNMTGFWWAVNQGEVMPCEAIPPIAVYAVSDQDVRELPELDRYLPRLGEAVTYLNNSVSLLDDCGIITPLQAGRARNDAINARVIFEATIERLDALVENVIQ
ncbi:MAG: SH3 domain-containing protein [Aggregatilineales bacterium]